jgi:transporter family protein
LNDNAIAVLLGSLVAVGFGIADFWAARASKKIGPVTALVAINIFLVIFFVPIYLLTRDAHQTVSSSGIAFAVLGGVMLNAASILFFKGLVAGPVSLVSPISAAYPLVSALLAVAVFGARLSTLQIFAIVIIVLGVMAAAGVLDTKSTDKKLGKGPLLAIGSIIFYGVGFSSLAQAAQRIGWQHTTMTEFLTILVVVCLSVPFVKGKERVFADLRLALKNRFVMLSGLAATLTILTFNAGFTHEKAGGAIIIAVSACYPVVTVAMALRHFKEEVRLLPLLGAAVSVAGVVVLSVG